MQQGSAPSVRTLLFLALISLTLFLPGFFSLPPVDRDEARFAQASKQMIESGDFVDIRFQDEPRHKKPIGIYWLQSAAVALSGAGADAPIWVYRLPSLLGAVLAVLLTAAIGARLFDRRTGLLAAVLLASSLLLGVEARLAKTDAALLACIMGAQLALARAWIERDRPGEPALLPALGFWLAVGAGILIKGPIILLVCGGTAFLLSLWERSGRWLLRLRPGLGVPLAVLVVAPWLIAIAIESDGAFFGASIGRDLLGKVLSGQESHGAPPGYYTLAVWLTFWPASLLLVLALPWIWMHRHNAPVRFCLAWGMPVWIVFELVVTKLPHYVLPAYPALALLAARALIDGLPGPKGTAAMGRLAERLRLLVLPIWLLITLALALAPVVLGPGLGEGLDIGSVAGAGAIGAAALAAVVLLRRGAAHATVAALAVSAAVFSATAYQVVLPDLSAIWPSVRAAEAVATFRRCPESTVAAAGFSEPSLVFLLGTGTQLTDAKGAARHIDTDPACGLALIEKRELPAFLAALKARNVDRFAIGSAFNYSNGRRIELALFRAVR